ncbi:MAG: hypothetical protein JO033_14080 [Acidobacteriaceae bacterium]|nr:hypothetical protein [Acidobacteriaceae bacterium]MBV9497875.1 hypothetical protein [Acidobacteriaceae bacterium]
MLLPFRFDKSIAPALSKRKGDRMLNKPEKPAGLTSLARADQSVKVPYGHNNASGHALHLG